MLVEVVSMVIRPYDDSDVDEFLRIRNQTEQKPMSRERYLSLGAEYYRHALRIRLVADAGTGLAGFAMATQRPIHPQGLINVRVQVDEPRRNRGIGTRLLDDLLGELGGKATLLEGEIRDHLAGAKQWAEEREFVEVDHVMERYWDREGFDPTQARVLLQRAQSEGFRFFSLGENPREDEVQRFYELFSRLQPDMPDDSLPVTQEFFRQNMVPGGNGRGLIVAADSRGRWVGLAVLTFHGPTTMHILFLGVERDMRGRGPATGLFAYVAVAGHELGMERATLNTSAHNRVVRLMAARFGAKTAPGYWILRRPFGT